MAPQGCPLPGFDRESSVAPQGCPLAKGSPHRLPLVLKGDSMKGKRPEKGGSETGNGGNQGTWYVDDEENDPPGWTGAHETGHLMSLWDARIPIDSNNPRRGYQDNIMGPRGATGVFQSDIQHIIDYSHGEVIGPQWAPIQQLKPYLPPW